MPLKYQLRVGFLYSGMTVIHYDVLCLLFNEVDLVFIEIIVGYITPVNASSMR